MAKRGGESFGKRAREKARLERQEAKRVRRETAAPTEVDSRPSRAEEDALMNEFADLSARYQSDQITAEQYNQERRRILAELGIEDEA